MKISCERCRADYDIEDAKIPSTGFRMTCPACSNEIVVPKSGAAAPAANAPREIALSDFEEEAPAVTPPSSATVASQPSPAATISSLPLALADEVDFTALAQAAPPPPAPPAAPAGNKLSGAATLVDAGPVLELEPELPVPVARPAAPSAPARAVEADLPAPVSRAQPKVPGARPPSPAAKEEIDLPAPKPTSAARPPLPPGMSRPPAPSAAPPPPGSKPQGGSAEEVDLPAPRGVVDLPAPRGVVDLPAPRGVVDLPAPRGVADLPAPRGVVDLPTPRGAVVDLPTPRGVGAGPHATAHGTQPGASARTSVDEPGLGITLDLDAPDVDDAPAPEATELQPRADGSIDLPTPRADGSIDLPAPRADGSVDLPTPRGDGAADFSRGSPAIATPIGRTSGSAAVVDDAAKPRRRKLFIAGGGLALALVIGGGVFAMSLIGGGEKKRIELDAKLASARRALAEDTLVAYRRAAAELKPLSSGEKPSEEAALIEAQAHLLQAQLGVAGELAPAKSLLDRPSTAPTPLADRQRAEGLRALVSGDVAAARKALKDLLGRTPLDAAALSYLGWTELAGRDLAASEVAFARAASVEASRAQALYGLGLARERTGELKAAADSYRKTLAASPEHFRARLGQLRLAARGGDAGAVTKLEALVLSKASSLSPREQAEVEVTFGQLAIDAGRITDAEERFRKATVLDAALASSHIAWDARLGLSRARVMAGRGGEAVEDLRKQVALDLRGIEPRLLLAEALIEKQEGKEAEGLIGVIRGMQPKEPRLSLLRGRLLVGRATVTKEDREQAAALFREATVADPSLLPAWAALAKTLHDLGRNPEALEVLGKAAEALSGDPRGAAVLGSAYLAIGKAADAEARFRAVLSSGDGKKSVEQLPVWIGLGEALEAQEKLVDAQATYAEAQKLAPKSSVLIEKQAQLAIRSGKLDDARKLLDEAMQLGPPSVALRLAAAELAFKTGHVPDARKLAESVMKDDERSGPAALLLARIELADGRPEDAIGFARRATMLQDMPEAHLVLAQVLERTNKFEGAAAEYDAARRAPTFDLASLGRARIMVRKGATRDALVELGPLVKINSMRAEVLVLQGDCYTDLQQADKARRAYEDAAKAAPQSPDAAFKLGRALIDAGHRQPGVDALERAVKLAPPLTPWLAEAQLLLGDAHRLAHENDAAVRAYQKYLELAPPTAPMRSEAQRQVSLLGGGK